MKCPLKFNKEHDVVDGHILVQEECEELQCAWYVIPMYEKPPYDDHGCCALYHLALKSFFVKKLDDKIKGV